MPATWQARRIGRACSADRHSIPLALIKTICSRCIPLVMRVKKKSSFGIEGNVPHLAGFTEPDRNNACLTLKVTRYESGQLAVAAASQQGAPDQPSKVRRTGPQQASGLGFG